MPAAKLLSVDAAGVGVVSGAVSLSGFTSSVGVGVGLGVGLGSVLASSLLQAAKEKVAATAMDRRDFVIVDIVFLFLFCR
jgi:hypothetical protein